SSDSHRSPHEWRPEYPRFDSLHRLRSCLHPSSAEAAASRDFPSSKLPGRTKQVRRFFALSFWFRDLLRQVIDRRDFLALASALATFGAACKKSSTGEIRIGAYLPLSGSDSAFGADLRDGIVLAIAQINEAGGVNGKKLLVHYEDDKSLPLE